MALDTAQVSLEEVIYIDNVQMFMDIATDLGIRSIRHINYVINFNTLADSGTHSGAKQKKDMPEDNNVY